jgi:hypothetical protein
MQIERSHCPESCDANAHNHDRDDYKNNDTSVRLHKGWQRQQGCVQDGRCTNFRGQVAGRHKDYDLDSFDNDGLHQVVQQSASCLPHNNRLLRPSHDGSSNTEAGTAYECLN